VAAAALVVMTPWPWMRTPLGLDTVGGSSQRDAWFSCSDGFPGSVKSSERGFNGDDDIASASDGGPGELCDPRRIREIGGGGGHDAAIDRIQTNYRDTPVVCVPLVGGAGGGAGGGAQLNSGNGGGGGGGGRRVGGSALLGGGKGGPALPPPK